MVSLYLHKPPGVEVSNDGDARRRREWLENIGAVLQRVVGVEARMWLITTLSLLEVPSHVQVECFFDLLQNSMRDSVKHNGGNVGGPLELQFTRMLCENRPRIAAELILDNSSIFKKLFSDNRKNILLWFGKFAGAGQTEHQQGARALANYAFRNRDLCWHLLVWEGKHAQAPSTVAAKPHYFLELDVVNTVQNFLENEPEFWWSDEFRDSLKDGEFLFIDIMYFAKVMVKKLASDIDSALDTWKVLKNYIKEESFSILCQQLLHVASDDKLLMFVNHLGSDLPRGYKKDGKNGITNLNRAARSWMEVLAFAGMQWKSLVEPMFCNACINHGRNVLRVLQQEEHEEDADSLKQLINNRTDDEGKEHWALKVRISRMDKATVCRCIALEAWVLFYQLSSCSTGTNIEALLNESGVQFRHHSPAKDVRDRKRNRKSSKRLRKRRQRRHRSFDADDSDDQSSNDIEFSNPLIVSKEEQEWRVSIDNYGLSWTRTDLAEYLTGFAVQRWLDWLSKT